MNKKKAVSLVAAASFAGYLYAIAPSSRRHPYTDLIVDTNFAHRGLFDNEGIPENSLPAFEEAIRHGYGIELDVRITADGQVVVFHDETLRRMCNVDKTIEKCTYEELSQYSLLHTGCTIPTLAEVLKLIKGQVSVLIEIKDTNYRDRICVAVYRLLSKYKGVFCIESFNPFILEWFRKYAPNIMRGQLSMNFFQSDTDNSSMMKNALLSNMMFNFRSRPHFIAYRYTDRQNPTFRLCSRMGATTIGWTFKDVESYHRYCGGFNGTVFEGFRPKTKIYR